VNTEAPVTLAISEVLADQYAIPSKPVVLYDSVFGFIEKGRSVTLHGVYGHRFLITRSPGPEHDSTRTVYTSPVQEVRGDGVFETLNTVYKPRALHEQAR
jgi:hypothetical protein